MTPPKARVLLLVEDNPGDALLVSELLDQDRDDSGYQIAHVARLADAVDILRTSEVDVVVLDLNLPDCQGVETVKVVREIVGQTPIVVLTGSEDDAVAHACIDAGAQDYLAKTELRSQNLRRAIGYAITRIREAQLRELQAVLDGYRALSSASQRTTVTAALAGSGAVAGRNPELFADLITAYYALIEPYLDRRCAKVEAPRASLEYIVTQLGDAAGGPRDLLDVHVAALDRAIAHHDDYHARSVVLEARLLALEMMGLLVDYYRVGQRRRHIEPDRAAGARS